MNRSGWSRGHWAWFTKGPVPVDYPVDSRDRFAQIDPEQADPDPASTLKEER